MDAAPDSGLDALLPLDGEVFFIDPQGNHWVKFEVKRVAVSAERPHGLRYSLTLHAKDGARLVGFDNAHPVTTGSGPGAKRSGAEAEVRMRGERVGGAAVGRQDEARKRGREGRGTNREATNAPPCTSPSTWRSRF